MSCVFSFKMQQRAHEPSGIRVDSPEFLLYLSNQHGRSRMPADQALQTHAGRQRGLVKRALVTSSLLFLGCGSPEGGVLPPMNSSGSRNAESGSGGVSGAATAQGGGGVLPGGSGGAGPVKNPLGRERCQAPSGMGSPSTIEAAVELLNALPKPTSVACFVESLDRPLAVTATNSTFSAQPALSNAAPRVFLKIGPLWMSIVMDGAPSELIEFGYQLPDPTPRSIKGELHLPLSSAIDPGAPYAHVLDDRDLLVGVGTVCRVCHGSEQLEEVPGIENVFSSVAFRPRPETYVSVESLRVHAQTCDWQVEPNRCEMLSALFDGGPVTEEGFPMEMPTFF